MAFEDEKWLIGNKLYDLLSTKGISQTKFAKMVSLSEEGRSISQSSISDFASNKRRVEGRLVQFFAEKLGVPVHELLDNAPSEQVVINIEQQNGIANGNYNTIKQSGISQGQQLEQQIVDLSKKYDILLARVEELLTKMSTPPG